jgi:hypothetical protein
MTNNNENKSFYCPDCGNYLTSLSNDYLVEWPNSADRHIADLEAKCSCKEQTGHDVVCPECGEVLGFVSDKYAYECPYGSGVYESQLQEEHWRNCHQVCEYSQTDWQALTIQACPDQSLKDDLCRLYDMGGFSFPELFSLTGRAAWIPCPPEYAYFDGHNELCHSSAFLNIMQNNKQRFAKVVCC